MNDSSSFQYLLRLGDDRLVLGHRLSEWCGHGPILEEDIALANIALDLIGEAALLLKLAGQIERKGRNEDALSFFRDSIDYRNALLVELPIGDFALTTEFDRWDDDGVRFVFGNDARANLIQHAQGIDEDTYRDAGLQGDDVSRRLVGRLAGR